MLADSAETPYYAVAGSKCVRVLVFPKLSVAQFSNNETTLTTAAAHARDSLAASAASVNGEIPRSHRSLALDRRSFRRSRPASLASEILFAPTTRNQQLTAARFMHYEDRQ